MKSIFLSLIALLLTGPVLAAGEPQVANGKFETLSPAGGLEAALRQVRSRGSEPVWVGYSVPMVAGMGRVCCFSSPGWKESACSLEGKNNGWGTNRDKARADQDLNVLLRFAEGRLTMVRGLSADCPLDAGGRRFVWLGSVAPESSVAYLAGLARNGQDGRKEPTDEAISTLALHRNGNADAVLEDLATSRYSAKRREQALFWMGQTRGERGARYLANTIRDDRDDKIRDKAVFSLSQSDVPWAADTIIKTAREDRSPHIRGEALFWLAQMKSAAAPDVILDAIEKDPELEVRKKGVFALSQLHGEGVSSLLRVAREAREPAIRKEAFFWLAQSKDPGALKYLDKVLNDD